MPTAGADGHSSLSHAALSTGSTHAQEGTAAQLTGLWGPGRGQHAPARGWVALGFCSRRPPTTAAGRRRDHHPPPSFHRRIASSCCLGQTAHTGSTAAPAWACQQAPRGGGRAALTCAWPGLCGGPVLARVEERCSRIAQGRNGHGCHPIAACKAGRNGSVCVCARALNCRPARGERPRTAILLGVSAAARTHGGGLEQPTRKLATPIPLVPLPLRAPLVTLRR